MRGDKRERIIRVLLNSSGALSKNELSKLSGCSRQWVIIFLKELSKKRLMKGTHVPDKRKMMDYWLGISRKPVNSRSYMVKEPLGALKKSRLDYALTTYQAENLVQHHLFPSRIDLYVREEDLDKWHGVMTGNGLVGGGNVRLIVADDHVMYGKMVVNGLSVVSLPQLVLDLMREGGPCQEAAGMLMGRL
jgi:hypothetical protein